ncbi:hypothetical protein EXD82_02630 [Peptacetobacter hominis]|uniref:Uncharacterized protein n=1 Tax=Peptacetobacter hominis TaxID=2743610 RepID=A0A544QXB2_9FIRM|nr:hypothetical protein [Peptacetobacter hominis]TQQ85311.1 hypothetical protein EXD82_02630 [Peptacetobacter hominis]
MALKLDRNIMQWFDSFFEDEKSSVQKNNFLCKSYVRKTPEGDKTGFTLEKENSDYWKMYFEIPQETVIRLKKNVHPIFREYIYEKRSFYNDNMIYDFINSNLLNIFNNVAVYTYDKNINAYIMNFSRLFVERCRYLSIGEDRKITENLYINAETQENFRIFNRDRSFVIMFSFDASEGENLLDSLIDLRKSIIINDGIK